MYPSVSANFLTNSPRQILNQPAYNRKLPLYDLPEFVNKMVRDNVILRQKIIEAWTADLTCAGSALGLRT